MAVDFTNKNPQDPNGLASLDTSTAQQAWVKDKDWSTVYTSLAEAKKNGANNPVFLATAITNDGHTYNVILDSSKQPISQVGDTTGYDDDQKGRWAQTGPKPLPPGGSPTQRQPDGSINAYNPTTGVYDTPTGAVATAAKPAIPPGGSSSTEGTPDPSKPGGWDNNRPREVIRKAPGPNGEPGAIVWSEELQGADLTAWRANQQAGQPQTGEVKKPVEGRPGWTSVTRATVQNGNKTETTTFIGPDGQETGTLPEKPKDPTTALSTINGQPGYRTVITPQGSGKPDTVEYFAPDGTKIPKLPGEASSKETQVVKGGRTLIEVTTSAGGTTKTVYLDPATRAEVTLPTEPSAYPKGVPSFTPDPNKPGYGLVERRDQLIALADAGTIPRESVAKILEGDKAIAETIATQHTRAETEARLTRQQNETERAGRSTMVNNAWDNAMKEPAGQEAYAGWNAPYRFAGQMALQGVYGGTGAWGQAAQATAPTTPPVAPGAPPVAAGPNAVGAGGIGAVPPAGAAPVAAPVRPGPLVPVAPAAPAPVAPAAPYAPGPLDNVPTPPRAAIPGPVLGQGQDLSSPIPGRPTPGGEMVRVTDQWGNTMTIPRSSLANRPGGTADLTIEPAAPAPPAPVAPATPAPAPFYGKPGADPSYTGEPMPNPSGGVLPPPPAQPSSYGDAGDAQSMAMPLASPWGDAAYGQSSGYDDTERNLIAEGFDPGVVARVKARRMAMVGASA